MEFFVNNWNWFLVGGIIILMALIGYIAEKTDFGRKDMPKQEKVKKPKKEKKKEKNVEEKTATTKAEEPKAEVQMALATDAILESPIEEDLNVPFGDSETNQEHTDTVVEQPVDELNDLKFEETYTEPTVQEATNVEVTEDLNVPFGDVTFDEPFGTIEEVVVQEPTEELKLDDVNELNVELPDLDTIVTEEDDSDDVWKF